MANIAGAITALLAAIPGFLDWLFIPAQSKAKQTGLYHMACNVVALICYGSTAWLECPEWNDPSPGVGSAVLLTGIGFVLTLVAGFLGWTLVQKHHVGVDMDRSGS